MYQRLPLVPILSQLIQSIRHPPVFKIQFAAKEGKLMEKLTSYVIKAADFFFS
jgi:hypothetical protein